MNLSGLVAVSLVVVLIDRHVLDRVLGTASPLSTGEYSIQLLKAGIAFCLLVPATCCAWVLADFALLPAGLSYLYPLTFMMFIVFFALGGDVVLARSANFPLWSRFTQRAAVLGMVLGLMALIPLPGDVSYPRVTLLETALASARIGLVFGVVLMLFTGVRKKTRPGQTETSRFALARDITLAALLAMALGGFSGLHLSGW